MTWTDARTYCRSQYPGGDLASIHTGANNNYVRQLCQQQLQALGECFRPKHSQTLNFTFSTSGHSYDPPLSTRFFICLGGNQDGHSSCWVGANDKGTEGTEVWSDGTEIVSLAHTSGFGSHTNCPTCECLGLQ